MAAIFDLIHNEMSELLSDHTTKSDLPEKPMGDADIVYLLLFYRKKNYQHHVNCF